MGDMFSTKSTSATQTTLNKQVGVSGTSSVGVSGDFNRVNVTTLDLEALKSAENVAVGALNANRDVSLQSINYSGIIALEALQSAQNTQKTAAASIDAAVARAENIALTATPVSPGQYAASTADQNKKLLVAGAIIAGILVLTLILKKT